MAESSSWPGDTGSKRALFRVSWNIPRWRVLRDLRPSPSFDLIIEPQLYIGGNFNENDTCRPYELPVGINSITLIAFEDLILNLFV